MIPQAFWRKQTVPWADRRGRWIVYLLATPVVLLLLVIADIAGRSNPAAREIIVLLASVLIGSAVCF